MKLRVEGQNITFAETELLVSGTVNRVPGGVHLFRRLGRLYQDSRVPDQRHRWDGDPGGAAGTGCLSGAA